MAKSSKTESTSNEGVDVPFGNKTTVSKTQENGIKDGNINTLKGQQEVNRHELRKKVLRYALIIFVVLSAALVVCAIARTWLGSNDVNTEALEQLQKFLEYALTLDLGFLFAVKLEL